MERPGPRILAAAGEALRIRRGVLRGLAGGAGPAVRTGREAPEAVAGGWRVFLRAERCALLLPGSATESLPPRLAATLADRLAFEEERAASVRAALDRLRPFVLAEESPVAVLKGGAHLAAGGEAMDVADVDLLVSRDRALAFAGRLDAAGARPQAEASEGVELGGQHLTRRYLDGSVPIEVHHRLRAFPDAGAVLERARRLAPGSPYLVLAPDDHLWHLLFHATVQHPFRRGSLRDLRLTALAMEECAPAELASVRRRIEAHESSETLGAQLAMAGALRRGEVVGDRFRRATAASYVLEGLYGLPGVPSYLWARATAAAFALVGTAADRRRYLRRLVRRPRGESAFAALGAVERRLPRLGTQLRRLLRFPRSAAAFVMAAPVAVAARWLTRGSSEPGSVPGG